MDLDLAEYAGAGSSTQRYILQAYDLNHRLDNSLLQLTLNITLREGDLVFQRPFTRYQPTLLPGEETSIVASSGGREREADSLPASPELSIKNHLSLSDLTGEDSAYICSSSTTSINSQTESVQSSKTGHSRHSSEDSKDIDDDSA